MHPPTDARTVLGVVAASHINELLPKPSWSTEHLVLKH